MEIFLPSVKNPYSRNPSFHHSKFSIRSLRETIFLSQSKVSSWNNFQNIEVRKLALHNSSSDGGSIAQQGLESLPLSLALDLISSETQFDRIVGEAQQLEEAVVILWMANWCRKCIYLKPKLEKLAADYYPRIRFYAIDVNNVPHKLVTRAGVTKMPTIQLWRDGEKQAEVIGGHKAFLVVSDVREMIENENGVV